MRGRGGGYSGFSRTHMCLCHGNSPDLVNEIHRQIGQDTVNHKHHTQFTQTHTIPGF